MKIVYGLILMIALMTTVTFYIDNQSETNVYNFCRSYSIGNSIIEIADSANEQNFMLDSSNSNSLLVKKNAVAPWSKTFTCEIIFLNDKITQLNFIIN